MKEDVIKRLKEKVSSLGGEILDTDFSGEMTKVMRFRCKEGHHFNQRVHHLLYNNRWCTKCSNKPRFDTSDIETMASSHDWEFLGGEYHNNNTKYLWKCSNGHFLRRTLICQQKVGWRCVQCVKEEKNILDMYRIRSIAEERGGMCLSDTISERLLFECSKGHTFSLKRSSILNAGSWCARCSQQARRLRERMEKDGEGDKTKSL